MNGHSANGQNLDKSSSETSNQWWKIQTTVEDTTIKSQEAKLTSLVQ